MDGPGIRTTVFFKGCNLRCLWCHNPESFSPSPQSATLTNGRHKDWGTEMTVAMVMDIVRQDKAYYLSSGGGVTASGGEPLLYAEFVKDLFKQCHNEGIATAIETNASLDRARLEQVSPVTDLWLFDYKASTPEMAQELTGNPLTHVLTNLAFLLDTGASVILRCPIVPGLNDTNGHLASIAQLSQREGIVETHIMPFHNTARDKWIALQIPYQLADKLSMTSEQAGAIAERIRVQGGMRIVCQG